jgi:hypothetical protein
MLVPVANMLLMSWWYACGSRELVPGHGRTRHRFALYALCHLPLYAVSHTLDMVCCPVFSDMWPTVETPMMRYPMVEAGRPYGVIGACLNCLRGHYKRADDDPLALAMCSGRTSRRG